MFNNKANTFKAFWIFYSQIANKRFTQTDVFGFFVEIFGMKKMELHKM